MNICQEKFIILQITHNSVSLANNEDNNNSSVLRTIQGWFSFLHIACRAKY